MDAGVSASNRPIWTLTKKCIMSKRHLLYYDTPLGYQISFYCIPRDLNCAYCINLNKLLIISCNMLSSYGLTPNMTITSAMSHAKRKQSVINM